jgi:REP element-mobilizing transposase RayT
MSAAQLHLGLKQRPTHGGARKGAGRKPRGPRPGVSHHGRPEVTRHTPVHVTARVLPHVWNLRSGRSMRVLEAALDGAKSFRDFRVVHFSVQGNHIHLIVEADDNRALSEGMQGLSTRLAKNLNRMMGRHGKVFADRFHAHVLTTPAEVRNALAYVLLNHRSHLARSGERVGAGAPDRFSSAGAFDGWRDAAPANEPQVTSPPRTWLLATGWRRRGLVSRTELPAVPAPTGRS